jgi:hypothetical protein
MWRFVSPGEVPFFVARMSSQTHISVDEVPPFVAHTMSNPHGFV